MEIDPDLPEDEAVELVIDENIKMQVMSQEVYPSASLLIDCSPLQVENISKTEVILKAKCENREIYIHSWLYHIENGFIEVLRPPVNIKNITN